MSYRFGPLLFTILLTSGLLSVFSCSKPSELGLSLVETNPSDLFYTDTTSMRMTTVLTEPLRADGRARWLCGSYVDPIFGKTNASLYLNFRLTTTNASFPGAVFDSLILSLQYDTLSHYGGDIDNMGMQTWEVYRMNQSMTPETEYFSNQTFNTGTLLATKSFLPKVFDSVSVQGVLRKPHLRIRLDDALGQEMLAPDSAIYQNNTIFKNFLNGLYVKPKSNATNTAILRFLPQASYSKLTMYYTDSAGVARSYDFLTDSDAESVLNLEHNYNSTRVLQNNSSDTIVYLQGINGTGVRIDFPFLDSLGKVVINKAELYLYAVGDDNREYKIPNQLFCLERSSDGKYLLVDDVANSISRSSLNPYQIFGGTLNYDGDLAYFRMNLSQFFQRLIDNDVDEKAIYIQTASVTDTGRMLIGNQKSTAFKAKLYLTYSKFN
jgi:hypothetical protein